MDDSNRTVLAGYRVYPGDEMIRRSAGFQEEMGRRRTVREFSGRAVPREVIEHCIRTAAAAPSGANMQPWSFVAVSDDVVKRRIRQEAERVEGEFYTSAATRGWVEDLAHLGTTAHKPFLSRAPWLIVIFSQLYGLLPDGGTRKHYYVSHSVGIATGMLIAAVHLAGLVSLTYTPARMGFLTEILSRPKNEKPYMILVVGHPAEDATGPVITKKSLEEIAVFV